MPSFCAVSSCEQKYSHSENVSFHKFPLRNAKILSEWVKFANRGPSWKPSRWNSICSRHFDKGDFREYLSRKCLKKDAIPTVITKNAISYETYHLTGSPDDTRAGHLETDDYVVSSADEGKAETSELVEMCRLCGERADNLTCNPMRMLDEPEVELMFRKCLPAVNIHIDTDQSRAICCDCVTQLKQYSDFIDKVLSYQRELSANEHYDNFATTEHNLVHGSATECCIKPSTPNSNATLFIKQEPINVKQEKVDNSNRRPLSVQLPTVSPSLCFNPFADSKKIKLMQHEVNVPKLEIGTTYCCACDRIFGNNYEYRSHKCTSSEQCIDRELGNNCEIMEIITLNNPVSFIDLAEDENVTTLDPRLMKTESTSEIEQKERLEFEHAYAKRATNTCNLKQEIVDSNNDVSDSGYDHNDQYGENEEQAQHFNPSIEDAPQFHFECQKCNMSFVSQDLLDEHSATLHPIKMKICSICNAEFKSSVEYLIHKSKVHAHRYSCKQCKRKFSNLPMLRSHERLCTRESKDICLSCRHCGKSIQNLAVMKKHLSICTGRQNETVDGSQNRGHWQNCRSNTRIQLFNQHKIVPPLNLNDSISIEQSTVNQSFKFIVDDSKFIFLNERKPMPFNQPKEAGANEGVDGKFACDTCGRPFLSFDQLKQHKTEHDSERKFSCSLCPKTFKGLSGLKQHISGYHYKIKPYSCPVCHYSYALKGDMQRCRHSKLRNQTSIQNNHKN